MNQKLLDNNYIIIPNFISSYKANKLKDEFVEFSQKNNLGGDSQIPTSSADYNYISFLELLCEKTPEVSEILEETVLPTYTYARVYKNGSVLKKHSDRDPCEISLTLHLGGDKPWLIWIKTPEGEDRSVELNLGDAMMYRGTIAEHWRDEYVGNEYTQVFLHYVRSRGDCAYTYFDTEDHKGKHSNHNKKIITDKTLEVEVKEDTIKRSPILIKPASKLEDFVQVFDNVLSPENCNLILNEYKNTSEWEDTITGGGEVTKNSRNCMEIPISFQHSLERNFDVRKNLDGIIFESVKKVIDNYKDLVPTFNIGIDTGYELLRYREGEFYIQHTDSFKEQQRSLSCSFQLNEDYEGGEFALFDREMMIRTKPGSAIVFPSNFMYPHEIMPVIRGTRYSIITWLV
jgi:hypothetical protein